MLVCGMLSRSASSDAKSTDSISFVSSASFSEGLGAGLGDGGGEAISSGEFEPLRWLVVAVPSRDFGRSKTNFLTAKLLRKLRCGFERAR